MHFSPVFSPFPSTYAGSRPATPSLTNGDRINDARTRSIEDIQSRLNRSSTDLTRARTPSTERKRSVIIDTSEKYGNNDKQTSVFFFPDTNIATPIRRRSSSVNYSINSRKIK